ncbi:Abi family protein [Geomicrobium sp. JCM 19038]|uniref:Abi family protein n=1 Tax=Geomicrobium sp. JCM 19038 TaxID=1460635 RepID=UPI00045F2987|nr:Abi family protein [Geomicrobium sp. JCM 19038]GAK09639.1 hypothetical protein JCM19038_3486 [Geomicrobium sp. JCM 19038]
MVVLDKPFINLDKQLEKLESRGLIIPDRNFAKKQLLKTTYYDLINGYKDMFLIQGDDEDDKYIEGTTFEQIYELFHVDRELRNCTLHLLLDIETRFYSSLSYSIAEIYGEQESCYLNKDNFKMGQIQRHNNRYERDNLFSKIDKKTKKPKVQPLIYYKKKYGNIPPWILVKDLTFGELVMLYKLSKSNVKTNTIRHIMNEDDINDETKEFFLASMKLFNQYRNWAAHGGRIYNYSPRVSLPYNSQHFEVLNINRAKYNQGQGQSDFSALVIGALFFLSDPRDLFEFIIKINNKLNDYQQKQPIQHEKILKELRLPSNFYQAIMGKFGL